MMDPMYVKPLFPLPDWAHAFPATKPPPKEMLLLVDKPLIQYVVEEAVASGIEDIIVITGRGKRAIEDHFDRSLELEENLKGSGKGQVLNQMRHISNLANFCYVRQPSHGPRTCGALCATPDRRRTVCRHPGDEIIDASVPGLAQLIHIYKQRKGAVLGVQGGTATGSHRYGIISARKVRNGLHRVDDLVEKPAPADAPSNLCGHRTLRAAAGNFPDPPQDPAGKNGEIPAHRRLAPTRQDTPMFAHEVEGQRHDAGDKLGFHRHRGIGAQEPVPGTCVRRVPATATPPDSHRRARRRGQGRTTRTTTTTSHGPNG